VANPQVENGYTRLANELLEALAITYLTPSQSKCLFYLARQTYGYQRKSAKIKTWQWCAGTGLEKGNLYRTLRELRDRRIVVKVDYQWGINKRYTQWREVVKGDYKAGLTTSGGQVRLPFSSQGSPPLIKEKRNLKESKPCPQCGAPKKEPWHEVCSKCYGQPTGRVQPSDLQPEPCTKCGWTAYPGYTDMKEGLCLDCRQ
jgi:phage replication O-like protein O